MLPRFCRRAKSWGHSPSSPSPLPAPAALCPPVLMAPSSPGTAAVVTRVLHTPKTDFQAFIVNSSSYIPSRDGASPDQQPWLKHSPCRCTPREHSLKHGQTYVSIYVCLCAHTHTHTHTRVFSTVTAKTSPLMLTPGCCQGFRSVFWTMQKVLKSCYSNCKNCFYGG